MKIAIALVLATALLNLLPAHAAGVATAVTTHDGQHDFDWEIGTWNTQLKRLRAPLSGKQEWVEYTGTTLVKPVMGNRANLVELSVTGSSGTIAAVSMRLYQPATGQWSLNFANLSGGVMTNPMFGEFHDGRGVFYGIDTANGRTVLVRFLIQPLRQDQWRFEQAYSADGGATWESNWIAVDTRRRGTQH